MSVQAITWALDYRVRNVTEKAILLVLANYANEYGISWPSQRTLADQSACSERTIRRTLGHLESRGVIRRIARRRENGSRQSDLILLETFGGRKPAPPDLIDPLGKAPMEAPTDQAAKLARRPIKRPEFPGGKRTESPHPPDTESALDTSLIRQDSAQLAAACFAVAGPGLDRRDTAPLGLSAIEITRWIEAGADLAADVLPVIAAKTAALRQHPIRSWAYFTPAVLEAMARRQAPIPKKKDIPHAPDRSGGRKADRNQSGSNTGSDAWDEAVAKAGLSGRAGSDGRSRNPSADHSSGGGPCRLAYSREPE